MNGWLISAAMARRSCDHRRAHEPDSALCAPQVTLKSLFSYYMTVYQSYMAWHFAKPDNP